MQSPLIVAVAMEETAKQKLTQWRERYFPPERNYLAAHLMVYHRLDGAAETRVTRELATMDFGPSFSLSFKRLMSHPGYVGIEVEAPQLLGLKRRLDLIFNDLLVSQDRQGYRPHVTIVNKVGREEAARSAAAIAAEFTPFTAPAVGLELHRYLGGPWQLLHTYSFQPSGLVDRAID